MVNVVYHAYSVKNNNLLIPGTWNRDLGLSMTTEHIWLRRKDLSGVHIVNSLMDYSVISETRENE